MLCEDFPNNRDSLIMLHKFGKEGKGREVRWKRIILRRARQVGKVSIPLCNKKGSLV